MQTHDDDPRSCPPSQLLRVMHRILLLCPVMGLPNEYEALCIKVPSDRASSDSLEESQSSNRGFYTWKALGSRYKRLIFC